MTGAGTAGTGAAPRVLVVDDQALVRTGFRMILAADGIEVVGEAADGEQAVAEVQRTRPDVVLMDIRMPGMDGLEATRRITAGAGAGAGVGSGSVEAGAGAGAASAGLDGVVSGVPRVLILTTYDLDRYVYEALRIGASGFLLKDVTPEHLAAAVRLVRAGDALLAPAITRRLVERFAAPTAADGPPHRDLAELTPREVEVLRALARGLSNAEVAAAFRIGESTAKTHVARILSKLRLRDRAQAVIAAYETGLVTPGTPDPHGPG